MCEKRLPLGATACSAACRWHSRYSNFYLTHSRKEFYKSICPSHPVALRARKSEGDTKINMREKEERQASRAGGSRDRKCRGEQGEAFLGGSGSFVVWRDMEFPSDTFSKNSSKELNCSTLLLCHQAVSSESKAVIRAATRQPSSTWVKISERIPAAHSG